MSDERPKPEYGEYATPEQQAAAMGRAYVPPPPEPPAAPITPTSSRLAEPYPVRPSGYANRFLTVFLLGLGALSLIGNVSTYLNYATALKGVMTASGLSSVSVPSAVNGAGIPTLIANIVIFAASTILSVLVIRRGRVSFYIPILGFLLFVVVTTFLLYVYAPSYVAQLEH